MNGLLLCLFKSLVDKTSMKLINKAAQESVDALAAGNGTKATELWSNTETVVSQVTDGVNVYNILN